MIKQLTDWEIQNLNIGVLSPWDFKKKKNDLSPNLRDLTESMSVKSIDPPGSMTRLQLDGYKLYLYIFQFHLQGWTQTDLTLRKWPDVAVYKNSNLPNPLLPIHK